MLGKDTKRRVVGLGHEARYLVVDDARGVLAVVGSRGDVAAEEGVAVLLAVDLMAQDVAHAITRDHGLRRLRRTLQIVGSARRDVAVVGNFFCRAPAQKHREIVDHLAFRLQEAVLFRDGQGVAQRLAARDDRNLVDGVGVLEQVPHERVPGLVVGDGAFLGVGHDAALSLRAGDNALHGLLHLVGRDRGLVAPRGQKRRLIEQIRQIGAGKAAGERCDAPKIHGLVHGLALGVHLENLLAPVQIGAVHNHLAVEAPGTQQGRVEDVGAVRGRNYDDRLVLLEAVHLDEQLV